MNLWMEVGSSGGPDKNQVYGLSNTTAENLRAACIISTVGSSQSVSSTQSNEFVALQQHTVHLPEKYKQLSMNYKQNTAHTTHSPRNTSNSRRILNKFAKWSWTWHHRVVIHVRPFFSRMVPGTTSLLLLLILQLRHCANLIFFRKHIQFVMNII
jgi:hypothetical protein